MSKKKQEKNTQRRRITFKLEAPEAKEAILVGDFNSWDLKKHTMKKDDKGRWAKIVTLAPGGYEYKFLSPLEGTSISFSSMGNGRMIPTMIK
jgi:1,4-alpha-glucan branching enzyme